VTSRTTSATTSALIIAAAAFAMAGCGVRGALEKPSASGAGAPETTAEAESGQGKKAGEASKPHKGFVLDKILE
jgi:predicted small lipoprotein YifL